MSIMDRVFPVLPRALPSTRKLVLYGPAGVFFLLYAGWSVARHRAFQTTGYDLGIFVQGVRSYAEGRWPTSDLLGPGVLQIGDHFHPILALLAPFYKLWPHAETLLVAQAALVALSAVPVTRLAAKYLGSGRAVVVALAYGLSWGLLRAVTFDFHEVVFAVPMLAFAIERLARREWTAAVLWALPLVLVKEDLPLTLAAIGAYLWWQRQRKLGGSLMVFGVLAWAVLTFVVLPALNAKGQYGHWGSLPNSMSMTSGIPMKLLTLTLLLLPTCFLAVRSPLIIIAVPTLAWRFVSGNSSHWGISYHYSAVLMPVVFIAFVVVLARIDKPELTAKLAGVSLAVSALLAVVVASDSSPQGAWTASQQAAARNILDQIPDGESVAASNRLAPQLTDRATVLYFPTYPDNASRPAWLVVTRELSGWPTTPAEQQRKLDSLQANDYELVAQNDVVLLFHLR
jgi:uncharacterized membrane protein